MEGGGNRRNSCLNFDPLTNEYLFEVIQIKARNTAFENGITLSKFLFEVFGVTTEGECLAVPVFLMAGSTGGCASGASWVFRIALKRGGVSIKLRTSGRARKLPAVLTDGTCHDVRMGEERITADA